MILDVTATPSSNSKQDSKIKSSNATNTNNSTKESETNTPVVDALSKAINNAASSPTKNSESQTTSDANPPGNATTNNQTSSATTEPQKYDDDDIHLGEKVYKEEIANGGDVIKYVYKADAPIVNVTLKSAINAGKFDDKGKVDSMEDCVKICGESADCDVAFMLSSQCFNVHCYSEESCQTKPAFSNFYNPQLSYIKHRSVKKHKNDSDAVSYTHLTLPTICSV